MPSKLHLKRIGNSKEVSLGLGWTSSRLADGLLQGGQDSAAFSGDFLTVVPKEIADHTPTQLHSSEECVKHTGHWCSLSVHVIHRNVTLCLALSN